ncbi:MAG: hypothetical protein H6737_26910 [Alphaproteobacteria bacterium]|nr:hypothetical protein [Alphaproteobacteria bacterium]
MLLLLAALLTPAHADDYGTGQALALTGFGVGVAGNLVQLGGSIASIPYIDAETGQVSPEGLKIARPYTIGGGLVNRGGASLMGFGTLRMHAANRKAGAEYTKTFGTLGLGFGLASLGAFGAGQAISGTPDQVGTSRALTGSLLTLTSGGLAAASFTMSFIQYVVNNANKPAKRRKIEPAKLEWNLGATRNGIVLAGRF